MSKTTISEDFIINLQLKQTSSKIYGKWKVGDKLNIVFDMNQYIEGSSLLTEKEFKELI